MVTIEKDLGIHRLSAIMRQIFLKADKIKSCCENKFLTLGIRIKDIYSDESEEMVESADSDDYDSPDSSSNRKSKHSPMPKLEVP
jgi:hypothetical protein